MISWQIPILILGRKDKWKCGGTGNSSFIWTGNSNSVTAWGERLIARQSEQWSVLLVMLHISTVLTLDVEQSVSLFPVLSQSLSLLLLVSFLWLSSNPPITLQTHFLSLSLSLSLLVSTAGGSNLIKWAERCDKGEPGAAGPPCQAV